MQSPPQTWRVRNSSGSVPNEPTIVVDPGAFERPPQRAPAGAARLLVSGALVLGVMVGTAYMRVSASPRPHSPPVPTTPVEMVLSAGVEVEVPFDAQGTPERDTPEQPPSPAPAPATTTTTSRSRGSDDTPRPVVAATAAPARTEAPAAAPAPEPPRTEGDEGADGEPQSPADPGRVVRAANRALRHGELALALTRYEDALALRPEFGPALAGIARVHALRKEPGDARRWAERAVTATPDAADYHLLLGDALRQAGERGKAEASYRQAAELGSELASARLADPIPDNPY